MSCLYLFIFLEGGGDITWVFFFKKPPKLGFFVLCLFFSSLTSHLSAPVSFSVLASFFISDSLCLFCFVYLLYSVKKLMYLFRLFKTIYSSYSVDIHVVLVCCSWNRHPVSGLMFQCFFCCLFVGWFGMCWSSTKTHTSLLMLKWSWQQGMFCDVIWKTLHPFLTGRKALWFIFPR